MRSNVEAGAKFLDTARPNWYREIDLSRFNINSCLDCILGQLYGEYSIGSQKLSEAKDMQELCSFVENYGFTALNQNAHWREEILARLAADTFPPQEEIEERELVAV